MALRLIYKDLPLGAADDAAVSTSGKESFSDVSKLPHGVNTGAVATLEHNGWGLSQDYKARGEQPFAFWSTEKSNDEGIFPTPPTITVDLDNLYSATGLTFRFSPLANEFCTEISVVWYQGDTEVANGTFYPYSPDFVVDKTVEAFDRVSVQLKKSNLPNRRAKLEYFGIGVIREIGGDELTGASFIHEINLVSDALPMNVMDANLHLKSNAELLFQKKQPIEAYDGDTLVGVYYIESGTRTGERVYSVSAHDAIGVLEYAPFSGAMWLTPITAKEAIENVLGEDFSLDISDDAATLPVRGHIPKTTKREALRQIAFATGLVIDTAGTSKIRAFLPSSVGGVEIPAQETYQGGSVSISDAVTSVLLSYKIVWEAEDPAEQGEETLYFGGKTYAVDNAQVVAENTLKTAGMAENRVEYDGGYLFTGDTAPARAEALLAYHLRRKTYNASHILHDQKPGDHAIVALPWGDKQSGHIVKMTVTISGINASNTDFLLDETGGALNV